MRAIAYVSSASREMTQADLDFIVEDSRLRNEAAGITGVLLYCDRNFMQYIEGPDEAVRETYERILASEHHHQIIEMLDQAIVEREFGEWALGSAQNTDSEFAALGGESWRDDETLGPGAMMLHAFWSNCRSTGF